MRRWHGVFVGALAGVALIALMGATGSGLPSQPRFDKVLITNAPASTNPTPARPPLYLTSSRPLIGFNETDQAADGRYWALQVQGGSFRVDQTNDAGTVLSAGMSINRTGAAITSLTFGNGTDNPSFSFLGSGFLSFTNGTLLGNLGMGGSGRILLDNSSPLLIRDQANSSTKYSFGLTGTLDAATGFTVAGVPVPTQTSGGGTWTATGLGSSPTGNYRWFRVGDEFCLSVSATNLTGTSNATTFTITGLPSPLSSATTSGGGLVTVVDNGTAKVGAWSIAALSTTMTFSNGPPTTLGANVAFTSSGTKAVLQHINACWTLN